MKRKLIVLATVVLLVVGMGATNLFAYSTSTTQSIGNVHNGTAYNKIAYGHLNASVGVAELQIRKSNGDIVASDVYPAYPQNQSDTEANCLAYTYMYFYVRSVNGDQVSGTQTKGLKSYPG